MLKPQDTLIAVVYWSLQQAGQWQSVRELASLTGISPGEISKSAYRLQAARLLVARNDRWYAEQNALLEWLNYGVRYMYPVEPGGFNRGMPTAWNCPLNKTAMLPPTPALIWAVPQGQQEGVCIEPLHPSVLVAAQQNEQVYRVMALLDAIRSAKPRELSIAREAMTQLIKGMNPHERV